MGKHQELEEPSGSLPNGLLPGMGLVIRSLDAEHWSKAEERTAELIACIQPNQPSEKRRNAVADYVQHLIMKCFPCQVCKFGSVPLKTYLPDGDIDLTAFCHNQNLKDTWANQVLDMLQNEEQKENAEFHVKEVQYIQAEVKIIKCLVENIVVDISFNQIGGLCTLCFLVEIDNLIGQNHLFKRSIILIKAWCYYESRILGAHHGLISTYALETLVLYIFHVFNNSFLGPLEVLYRFLEFFSNFDWDNFCVSLWGPVPINSLPNTTAEPPRKDSGELLLSKLFLDACSSVYAVFPDGQENNGQQFVSKYFNVIDPLRVNNNLGRSVSKGNFFRIRSAFAFGAKRLARLHGCPKENITYEVNQFFMNTWERHGSGHRPDAPGVDLWRLKLSTPDSLHEFENFKKNINVKKVNDNSSVCEMKGQQVRTFCVSSPNANSSAGSMSRTSELSDASQNRSLKSQINSNSLRGSNRIGRNSASNQDVHNNKLQRDLKANHLVNAIQGRFLFARTHSSPELTDSHADVSAQIPHNRQIEIAKTHAASVKLDITNRRKNLGSESLTSHQNRSSVETPRRLDASVDPKNSTNYFHQDWSDALDEEFSSTYGTQGMHQEEQEVHLPLSLASSHLPFPIPISFLDPMDYTQPNVRGLVPTDIPSTNPSFSNVQLPHGSVAHQLTHYFPTNGLNSPSADSIERSNGNFGCVEMSSEEVENDFWQEPDASSSGGHDPEIENYEMLQTGNTQPAKMSGLKHVPPRLSGSGSYTRIQQKRTKEKRGLMDEESDSYLFQDSSSIDVFAEERSESSRFSSATHSNSLRCKTSLESSSDGSSVEGSKSTKEKRGKKLSSTDPATGHGKGKIMSENVSNQGEDDDKEWRPVSNVRTVNAESNPASQLVASLHVPRHHMPGFEVGQTSGSDSMFPIAPMLIGSGSRENMTDKSDAIEFYPTGPPVPFLTMLTVYNIPPQPDTADASILHFDANGSLDNCDSDKHFSPERFHRSEDLNSSSSLRGTAAIETSDDQKSDILTSDFDSHWHNLLFGRFCQNPLNHASLLYPSPVVVPPIYLQGHFPYDNPGRPLSANTNLFTQLMSSYGHHLIPATPLQSFSSRPPNVYQRYTDGMPRHRNGTGTYLPNPTVRERHSSSTRRRNNNYDRNDNHGDREGNPNAHSKSKPMARGYNHNQTEKSYSRSDCVASSKSQADRSWRHDKVPSFQSQSGPLRSNFSQNGPPNVAYNMYPLPAMNAVGVSSNAPSVPPVMMIYPFDHSATYGSSHGEQLEFGPVSPVGFPGMHEQSQINEGSRARTYEYRRFHGGSGPRSSPDQPSSPRYQRRI